MIDDEKQRKARRLLEKGSDKVAYDILKQLADGPRRPAELRAALGIASANFFTARYLMPLSKSGYIAVAGSVVHYGARSEGGLFLAGFAARGAAADGFCERR